MTGYSHFPKQGGTVFTSKTKRELHLTYVSGYRVKDIWEITSIKNPRQAEERDTQSVSQI